MWHFTGTALIWCWSSRKAWISFCVSGHFSSTAKQVELVEFANGTVWDAAAIQRHMITGTVNAMIGTAGNDSFVVDNADDTIVEGVNQGTDLVLSTGGYSLGANVENLTLQGVLSSRGTGNDLANTLTGNGGNNLLQGGLGPTPWSGAQAMTGSKPMSRTAMGKSTTDRSIGSTAEWGTTAMPSPIAIGWSKASAKAWTRSSCWPGPRATPFQTTSRT